MKPQKPSAAEGGVEDPCPGQEAFPTPASHRAAVSAQAGNANVADDVQVLGPEKPGS